MDRRYTIIKVIIVCLLLSLSWQSNAQGGSCYAAGTNLSFTATPSGSQNSTIQGGCSDGSSFDWQVGTKPSWLSAYRSGNTVVVTVSNNTGAARSGSVQLVKNGSQIGVFSVSQAAGMITVGQVSITSGLTQRCMGGGTSDYNATATNATSYSWSITNAWNSTINSSGTVNWDSSFFGTATVHVTAYGPNNSSTTTTRNVTVTGVSTPGLQTNTTEFCDGESATLTLGPLQSSVKYELFRDDSATGFEVTTNASGTPGGTSWNVTNGGTYSIRATQLTGSLCSITYGSLTITKKSGLGSPSITGPSQLCSGTTQTDFNISGGNINNTYSWSIINGGPATINSSTGLVTWNGFTGNATIRLSATAQCGTSTNVNKSVSFNLISTPGLQTDTTEFCDGESATLTLGPLQSSVKYELFRDDSATGFEVTTNASGTPGGTSWNVTNGGEYSIRATQLTGSLCSITYGSLTITKKSGLGSPSITGPSQLCSGTTQTDFNISGGNINNTYSWSIINGGPATINSSTGLVIWNGFTGSATVRLTATAECGNTVNIDESISFDLISTPGLQTDTTEFCDGESATLTLGPLQSSVKYELFRDDSATGFEVTTNASGTPGGTSWNVTNGGEYSIRATQLTGSLCSITYGSLTITKKSGLGSPSITGPSQLCSGTTQTDFNISGGNINNTYSWNVDGVGNTIDSSGTVSWASGYTGDATISVTATSECGSTITLTKMVEVASGPSLTVNDASNTCSSSNEITLTAFSVDFQPGSTEIQHRWWNSENGGNYISGTTDPNIPYYNSQLTVTGQSLDYWVSAVYNGCESERQKISATYDPNLNCEPDEPTCTASGVSDITFAAAGDETQFTITFDPNTSPCAQTVYLKAVGISNNGLIDPPNWLIVQRLIGNTFKLSVPANTTSATHSDRLVVVDINDVAVGNLNFLVTQPNCGSEAWYLDSDGDGLGDIFGQPIMGCQDPDTYPDDDPNTSWVNNNDDKCPYEVGPSSNEGCPGAIPENWNTVTTKRYDLNNTLKVASKSYFDQLGKLRQTQGWDVKSDSIWASATMYDNYGRQALSTIGAPIKKGVDFQYKTGFIKASNNISDYILKTNPTLNNITGVGDSENTLGWYYSESNDREPYQDITTYPFSRSIYSELNPGGVLQTAGGNKINGEWPQSYTFSMPAGQELSKSIAFGDTAYDNLKIVKTVSRNLQGEENVVFTDSEGRTLAAARSGAEGIPRNSTVKIGEQGFVDIHVPQQASGISTANLSGGMTIEIFDLITEELYTDSSGSIPNGFYRVAIKNWNPDSYNPNQRVEVTYPENYYDYTLSIYDKANNLTKSYQPVGTSIAEKPESLVTYDAVGRIIYSKSPDEGEAWFRYREDGQIRYSQNSKQKTEATNEEFSYTNYDPLGRPVESGIVESTAFNSVSTEASGSPAGTKKEQLFTVYDKIDDIELLTLPSNYQTPSFLSNNVAKTQNDQSTTYYSYDIYGRVKWMVQNITGLGLKTIDYEYEPITGLVTRVIYQKGNTNEQFVHRYTYNEIDELVTVETSTDNINFTIDAEYEYYETGAMKRTELAGVQGIDYVYNISGQLKSINHPSLDGTKDPGGDTNDLFGMQMDYHSSDYQRSVANIQATTYGTDRADGNLKGVRWNNKQLLSGSIENAYSYAYDRNNWLQSAKYGTYADTNGGTIVANDTDNATYTSADGAVVQEATQSITLQPGFHAQTGSTYTARIVPGQDFVQNTNDDYSVTGITYDANGNIKTLRRNKQTEGGNGNLMDDLEYHYDAGKPNQLSHVDDGVVDAANANDINDQSVNNYTYNSIGQLVEDHEYVTPADLDNIVRYEYNTSGLVTAVTKKNVPLVKFLYNDRNQRVQKQSFTAQGTLVKTTYYVRDVQGAVKGIYESLNSNAAVIAEHPVMGNGRIGMFKRAGNSGTTYYELTDHLGNVRSVFSKTDLNSASYSDYYPFGMQMPGRNSLSNNFYRYAFQGQEKDSETDKEAFELRLWDARIGRWLTTDPARQYASPYLGMGNNPIGRIDPDGGQDCGCKNDPDPPGFFKFFMDFFDSISNLAQSMSAQGPNPIFVDDVNKRSNYLNALTSEIEKTNKRLEVVVGIELMVVSGGTSAAGLSTSLISRGGLSAVARKGLFSFSTENAVQNMFVNTGGQLISNGGDYTQINPLNVVLSGYTSGLAPSIFGSVVDVRLDGSAGLNTNLTSIAVDVVSDQVTNQIHTKIDEVIPNQVLSPSGEVYKAMLNSGSQGVIGTVSNKIKE